MLDIVSYWWMTGLVMAGVVEAGRQVLVADRRRRLPVEVPRDDGQQRFDTAAGERWLAECRTHAEQLALERGTVTVDDVWDANPPPDGVDGRLLGQLFRGDGWKRAGTKQSARGRNATREIVVWQRAGETS